jgi:hypothetical protein
LPANQASGHQSDQLGALAEIGLVKNRLRHGGCQLRLLGVGQLLLELSAIHPSSSDLER